MLLMNAAVELFAQQGSRNVSIGQICEWADISRPTFYRCFTDKEALVAAIYEESVSLPVQDILFRGRLSEPQALRKDVDRMLDAIFDNAPLARMVFADVGDPKSAGAAVIDRFFDEAAQKLARDLRRAGGPQLSRPYLKAVMAAIQWLVKDAIDAGLSSRQRAAAKDAAFQLVLKALS